ncbi:MAG: hypothetical protein Kow0092_08430 [Deferrisomatales bacterium]
MNGPMRKGRAGGPAETSNPADPPSLWSCFCHPATLAKGAKVALVVGPVLGLINHFDLLVDGDVTGSRLFQMGLTFLVPFCVSGYASATTMRAERGPCKSSATR